MRDISELVKRQQKPPDKAETLEEMNWRLYLEDVARMRDFTPEAERLAFPNPIRPKWRN